MEEKEHKRGKKKYILLFAIMILLASYFFGAGLDLWWKAKGYQAVFLTNGQVYFGKLGSSGRWLKLTDIYYLQSTQALQDAGGAGSTGSSISTVDQNIQLVKLGNELHGPTDAMYLQKGEVLFWENLKDDSKVVDAISKYKK